MQNSPGPKYDLDAMRPACGLVYHIYTSILLLDLEFYGYKSVVAGSCKASFSSRT